MGPGRARARARQVRGLQFIIEDCTDCAIGVFDHAGQTTVDACTRCVIVLGAVGESVFFRECVDCTFVVAAQQFRCAC